MAAEYWLDDAAWRTIEPLLPRSQPEARRVDDRRVVSGIVHVLRSGLPLEGLPSHLWTAGHDLQPMEPVVRARRVDAYLSGAGGGASCRRGDDRQFRREGAARLSRRKRGAAAQAIGRSRGGRTTKIHAIADGLGRPRAFLRSPGNIADITVASELLRMAPPCRVFVADRGYDARALRDQATRAGALVVIPNNPTRCNPHPFDANRYSARNAIERMFCRLNDFRRIATRYDRLARNFLSAIAIACFWIT